MSIATTSEKNALATKYATDNPYGSLHTADPGTTGTSEVTGGSPAYARKAINWGAASNGVVTGTCTFDVPAGTTVTFAGVWSAASAGTFGDKVAVTSQAFATQGTYTVTFAYTQT
jgi:hypothetical protein